MKIANFHQVFHMSMETLVPHSSAGVPHSWKMGKGCLSNVPSLLKDTIYDFANYFLFIIEYYFQ